LVRVILRNIPHEDIGIEADQFDSGSSSGSSKPAQPFSMVSFISSMVTTRSNLPNIPCSRRTDPFFTIRPAYLDLHPVAGLEIQIFPHFGRYRDLAFRCDCSRCHGGFLSIPDALLYAESKDEEKQSYSRITFTKIPSGNSPSSRWTTPPLTNPSSTCLCTGLGGAGRGAAAADAGGAGARPIPRSMASFAS